MYTHAHTNIDNMFFICGSSQFIATHRAGY